MRTMMIHFNDGSKKLFTYPIPVADSDFSLATRLREALEAQHLVLEADGALVVIPVGSIKYLKAFPMPWKLPAYAIRAGSLSDV